MLATFANLSRHPIAASGLAMHPGLARGHTAMRCAPTPCPALLLWLVYTATATLNPATATACLPYLLVLCALLWGTCLLYSWIYLQ